MKLALLGLDDQTLIIAQEASRAGRHQIVAVADVPAESLSALGKAISASPDWIDWESLVLGSVVDAVIVASDVDEERRADQLRKLVQAGIPLLVAHPALTSMLVYYELGMIQEESRSVLTPLLPWRWHPAAARLRELTGADGGDRGNVEFSIGQISQATFERHMEGRDRTSVLAQFARDVDLIRDIYGDVSRVAALGDPNDAATYANLGVQMSGPEAVAVRWSVSRADAEPFGLLTLIGIAGKITLRIPEDGPWSWELQSGDLNRTERFEHWDSATAALDRLESAIASRDANNLVDHDEWTQAARAVELAESVERSLARGRAIELHNEDFSDIGTFKGTMTSLGCGLLMGILALVFGIGLIGALFRNSRIVLNYWPYLLAGVLVLFLLVQLILKIVDVQQPSASEPKSRDDDSPD